MKRKNTTAKTSDKAVLRRLTPPLAFMFALCLLVVCFYDSGYSALPPTEKRYAAAKADVNSLKQDAKRSQWREPWEKLAIEFHEIYESDPDWPNRPAALFRAAESMEELAGRSFTKSDARKAAKWYESLALRHAGSRLADDALFRAARIHAAWLKEDGKALDLIKRIKSQYPRGDMLQQALALEKALTASAGGRTSPEAKLLVNKGGSDRLDEQAATDSRSAGRQTRRSENGNAVAQETALRNRYAQAKEAMDKLKKDERKRCWRQPWEQLQAEFESIYEARKDWVIAPGALYRSALSQEQLADCSHLSNDYRRALELYLALPQEFPQSALADDALLQAARIQSEHLGRTTAALESLERLLKQYARGDMAAEARRLQASWAPDKKVAQNRQDTQPTAERPELQVLSWDSLNKNSVEIVLEMSGPTRYSTQLLKNAKGRPTRLLVELENAAVVNDVRKGVSVNGSLLKSVRVRKSKGNGATLQFDFREVRRYDARVEEAPSRIVLTVAAGNTPLPRHDTTAGARNTAMVKTSKANLSRQTAAMASQLGLTVRRVFIDAGHGGRDPGTSHHHVIERAVTLDVALTLGRLLEANGLEVIYSRQANKAVRLSDRTDMANAARADLFVSIHVNAHSDPNIHGMEAYFLSLASSGDAARLAALENSGSDRSLGDMQDMLADVMLNARIAESRQLAGDILRLSMFRMKRRDYKVKNNGVRSAPFHVLLGAQMPAVLVELGYCTNPQEANRLASPRYRHALAEGLAEGIMAYRDRLLKNRTAENSLTAKKAGAM